MKANDVIGTLNGLIETSRDGEYGFRHVAGRAQSPRLRALFTHRADACALAAADLASCVRQLGGEPDTHGSAGGALHRGWAALRSSVAGTTDLALLEDCERSEDVAVERYRNAL